jgi:hypothetical protein
MPNFTHTLYIYKLSLNAVGPLARICAQHAARREPDESSFISSSRL